MQADSRALQHERAFGQLQALSQPAAFELDSSELLKNLDQLRKMQIDLALEHLALGNVPAERVSLLDMEQDEDSSRRYKRNAERFAKKEANVNNLMIRLEELSEAMRQFHFSMDEVRSSTTGAVGSEGMPTKSAAVIESTAGIVAVPAGRPR